MVDIFIFRRDLRLYDNTCLLECKNPVVPIFIFNKDQITRQNKYYNQRIINFMISALGDLNKSISLYNGKLYYFYGDDDTKILDDIVKQLKSNINGIYSNKDITPYALSRDSSINKWCELKGIPFIQKQDYTLYSPDSIKNKSGNPFKVYSPFKNLLLTKPIPQINKKIQTTFHTFNFKNTVNPQKFTTQYNDKATRRFSETILKNISKGYFKNYSKNRNQIYPAKTTQMAVYLKFGLISIREAYQACISGNGRTDQLSLELLWKEYYYHLCYHFPRVLKGQISNENKTFKEIFNTIKWDNNPVYIKAFLKGTTGYPLVDAGIRELLETGYMHNRVRMIVASFLTKNLWIDWRIGERFFAQNLLDYDPCANNGGWQWGASTGVDTQPYRIFSVMNQTKMYDSEAKYIIKWVPELEQVPFKDILNWENAYKKHTGVYTPPIVNSKDTTTRAKKYLASFYKK